MHRRATRLPLRAQQLRKLVMVSGLKDSIRQWPMAWSRTLRLRMLQLRDQKLPGSECLNSWQILLQERPISCSRAPKGIIEKVVHFVLRAPRRGMLEFKKGLKLVLKSRQFCAQVLLQVLLKKWPSSCWGIPRLRMHKLLQDYVKTFVPFVLRSSHAQSA